MAMVHNIVLGGRFFGLFTGTHGSGKTVAVGSFPGPILVFDFDGRIDPIRNFYPTRVDIEYFTVGLSRPPGRSDVITFTEFCKRFEDLQDHCPYGTVVIDSYTMYSTLAVLHQMGVKDIKDVKTTKGGLPIPDWDEYKGETGVAVQIMETAKILPSHFIMTAHPVSKAMTTKQGGPTNEVLASMVRGSSLATYGWKTVSILPSYFNEMYYFHSEGVRNQGETPIRRVQTVSSGEIVAKTALPLPHSFEITNRPMFAVLSAILAEKKLALDTKLAAAKQQEGQNG